jgi:hypothetical protein
MSKHLKVNVHISVTAHYLKGLNAQELFRGKYDFSIPRLRLAGRITERKTRDDGKNGFNIVLDELPPHSFTLLDISLKYEGPRVPTVRAAPRLPPI